MSKLIDITAPQHRCPVVDCPAVYRSEDGKTFTIVGRTEDYRNLPEGASVSDDESIVEIPAEVLLASLGLPVLIEAAEPIIERLDWHENNLDYWTMASDENVGELEFPVTATEARALRSALNSIKGGDNG